MRKAVIDLGCGIRKKPNSIGMDVVALPGVDVVANMAYGLPFRDSSIDGIYVYHVLEHMDDFLGTMGEIWRVCKDGAKAYIKVPHSASPFHTWKDPTHRRGLSIATFAYFDDTDVVRHQLVQRIIRAYDEHKAKVAEQLPLLDARTHGKANGGNLAPRESDRPSSSEVETNE